MNTSSASDLDVIVGELTLLDGRRQSDVTHAACLRPPRRARSDRRAETLFVFLEVGAKRAGGLAGAMLEEFKRTYWHCSGPITSALRKAVDAANAHLREENRLVPVSQRRRAGLVCAVLRGDAVYLAQIGPAKALLVRDGSVTRFPKTLKAGLPLGVSSGLDMRFSRETFKAGDRMLLTGESWSAQLPEGVLAQALSSEEVGDVLLALERQASVKPFSAVVAQCAPQIETREVPKPSAESSSRLKLPQQEPLTPAVVATLGSQSAYEPEPSRLALHQFQTSSQVRTGVDTAALPAELAEFEEGWPPSKPVVGFSFGRERLDRSRRGLRRVSLALGDAMRALLVRVLPEPETARPQLKRRAKGSRGENVVMMAGIAIGIPLLIAFVVATFYLQRSEVDRNAALVRRAHEAVEAAAQAEADQAYESWNSALQMVREALIVAPDNDELFSLRSQALTNLDYLAGAVRPEFTELWEYGPGQGRRVAASRLQVYVLDAAQNQVTQHTLNQSRQSISSGELPVVAYRGQTVGDKDVSQLRDVIWMGVGGAWTSDALLILAEDNRLLEHSPAWGLSWLPFDTQGTHENVRILRPYDGKLYALDPAESRIWRFHYSADGFGSPEDYFRVPPPDLGNAVDMVIDGAVWILGADGQILKFFGGERQPFELGGLSQPLVQPLALASEGDAESGALYVADAGDESIVALTKDGQFIYRIKADDGALVNLEAMAIDQDSRSLYVLSNGRLYAVALPPVPE